MESRFWNPGNFCMLNVESRKILFVESRIVGFGIWKTAQGMPNSSSTDNTGIQYLYVPVLGSLIWGKEVIKH